jgi:hypothetical protein
MTARTDKTEAIPSEFDTNQPLVQKKKQKNDNKQLDFTNKDNYKGSPNTSPLRRRQTINPKT